MLLSVNVLVNCLPPNPGTHHFLNQHILHIMLLRGACLINLSQGAVIDDQALIQLLDEQHIKAAALDTFVEETLPVNSPYWQYARVFVTPHVAGSATKAIAKNIMCIEKGQLPWVPSFVKEHGLETATHLLAEYTQYDSLNQNNEGNGKAFPWTTLTPD
jgi:glyoxylate/hydroxypyruvate reductase A